MVAEAGSTSPRRQWAWYLSAIAYRFTDTAPSRAVDGAILGYLGDRLDGARVLDCGCGPGGLAAQFAGGEPERLLAVDANPGMVLQARRRLGVDKANTVAEVRRAFVDARFYESLGECFDVIVFKRSLYATPDAAAATVRSAFEVIAPGGVVIVAQPERRLRRYAFGQRPPYLQPHSAFHLVNRLLSRVAVALRISDYSDLTLDELIALMRGAAPEAEIDVVPSPQWAYALVAMRRPSADPRADQSSVS